MEDIIIDGIVVNKQRVKEHEFINELTLILKDHFNEVDVNQYHRYKDWYLLLEPYLSNLRKKYNLTENPPDTNSIIILHKSGLEAEMYNHNYIYVKNDYEIFLNRIDALFKSNRSYTTPKGYVYYFDRIPEKAITDLKKDIVKEYDLQLEDNQQGYILQHVLKEVAARFN